MDSNTLFVTRLFYCLALVLLFSTSALSKTSVVVFPVSAELDNVITVAKKGGDYTRITDALKSIPDSGDSSGISGEKHLIVIAPGTYFPKETLILKPNVHLVGSGHGTTVINSIVDNKFQNTTAGTNTVVELKSFSKVSNLTLIATVTGTLSAQAFGNEAQSNRIEINNVRASISSSGGTAIGIHTSSDVTVRDSIISVRGNQKSYGVIGGRDGLPTENSFVDSAFHLNEGSQECIGVWEKFGSDVQTTTLNGVYIGDGLPTLDATLNNTANSCVAIKAFGAHIRIQNSTIKGDVVSEQDFGITPELVISQSILTGTATGNGTLRCLNSNNSEHSLNTSCLAPD